MFRSLLLRIEPLALNFLSPLFQRKEARVARSFLIQKYCKGHGAEIGAMTQPVLVPMGSKTSYIDAVPPSFWRKLPKYKNVKMVNPDIIDEGATLSTVPSDSFDYLIAAHVLEHIDDPISALKNWLRVIKPGGHIVIAVPDMRVSDEKDRVITSVDHFWRDHLEGPQTSADYHYREHGLNPDGYTGQKLAEYIKEHERTIHYHTFTLTSFVEFLGACQKLGFEVLEACFNVNEDLAVIRRVSTVSP